MVLETCEINAFVKIQCGTACSKAHEVGVDVTVLSALEGVLKE